MRKATMVLLVLLSVASIFGLSTAPASAGCSTTYAGAYLNLPYPPESFIGVSISQAVDQALADLDWVADANRDYIKCGFNINGPCMGAYSSAILDTPIDKFYAGVVASATLDYIDCAA